MLLEVDISPHLGIQLHVERTPFLSRGRAGRFKCGQWHRNVRLLFHCSAVNRVPGDKDSEKSVI